MRKEEGRGEWGGVIDFADMLGEASQVVRGGRRGAGVFLLMSAFVLALAVSLAAAQVLAVLLVLVVLLGGAPCERAARRLWVVAAGYVGLLTLVSGIAAGSEGVASGVRNTWPILVAPAVCQLAGTLDARAFAILKRLLIVSSVFVAVLFLLQWSLVDPAVYGRYGCHRSPYAFAMLLIPPSLLVLADPGARRRGYVAWAILVAALVITKSRGPFLAWLAASAGTTVLLAGSFRWRRLVVPGLLLVLLLLLFMPRDRWELSDLSRQYSIQQRIVIWNVIVPEIAARPVLGHGFDRFVADPADAAPQYADWLRDQTNPHNGYLMLLHGVGGVGALILVVAYGTMLAMLLFARRHAFDAALTAVAAATLAGILVAAMADKTFFVTLVMLQAWLLVGLALAVPRVAATSGPGAGGSGS